jgi:death on curing protein
VKKPIWLDERDALALHGLLLALDGGAAGVRDPALLQSALARPQQLHAYGQKPDIIDMAAAYTFGLIRNHPFIDGNKRTAFILGALHLELNGYRLTATEESAAQSVMNLAAGKLTEASYSAWLRANAIRR